MGRDYPKLRFGSSSRASLLTLARNAPHRSNGVRISVVRIIRPDHARNEFLSASWRMGRDSNPRCLSAHTLSRRAQSTTLSPIPFGSRIYRESVAGEGASFPFYLGGTLTACPTDSSGGIIRRWGVDCR